MCPGPCNQENPIRFVLRSRYFVKIRWSLRFGCFVEYGFGYSPKLLSLPYCSPRPGISNKTMRYLPPQCSPVRFGKVVLLLLASAIVFDRLPAAGAGPISILNHSFEDHGFLAEGGFDNVLNDWNGNSAYGTMNPTAAQITGEDPGYVAWSNGTNLSQVLGEVLTANMLYTLQVLVGDRSDEPFPASGYSVQLVADGNILAEDNNTLTPIDGGFVESEVQFTALAGNPNLGENLEIHLNHLGGVGQVLWDNVRLDASLATATAVPEPGTATLVGIGVLGLAFYRRRNRNAHSLNAHSLNANS